MKNEYALTCFGAWTVLAALCGCTVTTSNGSNGGSGGSDAGASAGASGASAGGPGSGGTNAAGSAGASSDGDGGTATQDAGVAVQDPAPGVTEPGETRTCDAGGPDSDLVTFEYADVTDTSLRLQGTVSGATGDGLYYVSDGTRAIGGPVATDSTSGAFDVTLPLFCGEQLVKLAWTDTSCGLVVVSRVARIECSAEDIRVTLSWDALGSDFELHLIKENGRINDGATDCTWTSCIGVGPDWGVAGDTSDDPLKDVDDTNTYGPENIYYSNPEAGTYTVMVEHWGSGSAEADGQAIINVAGRVYSNQIQNLAPQAVWTVGTITWPSGDVTLSQDVFDCSASWAGGCTAEIP